MTPEEIHDWKNYLCESKKSFLKRYSQQFQSNMCMKDLEIFRTIGKGSFGTVVVARVSGGDVVAVKILSKEQLVAKRLVKHTLSEKRILSAIRFPFIIHMRDFFHDFSYVCFVMPYISGGELFSVIQQKGRLEEDWAMFYAAQVVLALEFLHHLGVVYRDLKPENLVLDPAGYLKIIDLGFAKRVAVRTYTICGTPDYLAPEVVLSRGYGAGVDWWALGVLVYEMCAGVPPFRSPRVTQTFELITSCLYRCPRFFSASLSDLLERLIEVDFTCRLGCLKNGAKEIKAHCWFRNVHWMDILNKKVEPPYIPFVTDIADTANFPPTNEFVPKVSLKDYYSRLFADF